MKELIDAAYLDDGQNRVEELTRQLYTKFDYFDFVRACQAGFTKLRASQGNGSITDLMLACFRGHLPHYERPPELTDRELQKYLVPPVIVDTSDEKVRVGSSLWPKEMSAWLVQKAAEDYTLFELMTSKGEIGFEAKLSRTERFAIDNALTKFFGVVPW
jgi:hypothetical protein